MVTSQHRPAPRQADVARIAGVSQATVSAVVNGRAEASGISAGTATKVLEVARELAYAPNPAARNLKGKRNRVLGVHAFESVFPISQRDFYHEFLMGVEEQAVAERHDLMLFTSTEGEDGLRRIYRDGTNRLHLADGSVLMGIHADTDDLVRLYRDGYAFVFIGRREIPGAAIPYVGADYASATADVVSRLAELEHRSVAYVGAPERRGSNRDRDAGFRAGCERAGIRARAPHYTNPEELGGEWFQAIVHDGATALLVEHPDIAAQVARLAVAHAVSIPRELSVVVLRNAPGGPTPESTWSAMNIPRKDMGREAVRLLVAMLTEPGTPHQLQIMLPCSPPGDSTMAIAPRERGAGADLP